MYNYALVDFCFRPSQIPPCSVRIGTVKIIIIRILLLSSSVFLFLFLLLLLLIIVIIITLFVIKNGEVMWIDERIIPVWVKIRIGVTWWLSW